MGTADQLQREAAGAWRGHFAMLDSGVRRSDPGLAPGRPAAAGGSDPQGPLPQHGRLSDAFFTIAQRQAQRTALVVGRRPFSYGELACQAQQVAQRLQSSAHFLPGDRVGLMLHNGPEFIAAYYGVLAAGGVLVPLPPNIEWHRLERIAGMCGIRQILSQRQVMKRRTEVAESDIECWDLQARVTGPPPPAQRGCAAGSSLAMIMFTSGSSGDPKGVMLSDGNLLANTQSILDYLPIGSDDRALALLPFYHAFGHSIMQTHLLAGATLVVDGNMAFPSTVVDALERHGATSFSAVPEGYYSLLSMSDLARRQLPQLRYMTVAGGALKGPSRCGAGAGHRACGVLCHVRTDGGCGAACLSAREAGANTFPFDWPGHSGCRAMRAHRGRPTGGAPRDWRVVCTRCERDAGLLERPPGDRTGAGRRLAAHRRSGQPGRAGFVLRPCAKNDLVKVQGFRIHPREVEDAIAGYFPGLHLIVVPYQLHGTTRLSLFGVTNQIDAELVDKLRRACVRELPRHKVPSYVEVLTQAPLNASMKLDRTALRRRAELQAESGPTSESLPNRLSA